MPAMTERISVNSASKLSEAIASKQGQAPMSAWQPAETAPRDRMILVDTGMPWASVATWSEYAEKWVLAELEWNVCDGLADPGFVTEYERTIKGWMELPEVAHG